MAFAYYLHPEARDEYAAAYAWYENQQHGLGEKFIAAVREKMDHISANPELYGSKATDYKETIVNSTFPYTIVYKIERRLKKIHVVAIYHHKRNVRRKYRK